MHEVAIQRQRGISLIELMVGIVVAMAAVVVVMQVFKVSEGARRTTTGSDDAQTVGAIALTVLQRDLRQAGQGLSNLNLLGCNLALPAGWPFNTLAPVTINHASIPAGDPDTDTLLIAYGSGLGSPEGDRINTQPGSNIYAVATTSAFRSADRVVVAPTARATPCELILTQVTGQPEAPHVTVATGMVGAANGTLYNWGQTPRIAAYAVRNGHLTSCDFQTRDCRSSAAANWPEVAAGIVSLRAQYGRDTSTARDAVVDLYDQTTPGNACGWTRVVALRLAVVARSGQYDKETVLQTTPAWAAGASAPIVLQDGWEHYRYRTFETTVPLRNMPGPGFADIDLC